MKKRPLLKLLLILTGSCLGFAAFAESSPSARKAADEMAAGFNLGQMFESQQHEPSLAEAKPKIDAYYQLGYRNVRIPVTWTEVLHGSAMVKDVDVGDIDFNHPRTQELIKVVDYALSLPGLYVVLNAHHEKELKKHAKAKVLERLWSDIADYFKDRDKRLVYEILNEPHIGADAMEPEKLRNMTAMAYEKIRALDPQRIIIIGGNQWFAADEMARTWPSLEQVGGGKDKYLMATFHHYNPWTYHGEDGDKAYQWQESDVTDPMATMEAWASSVGNGMPIYIGEWGNGWGKQFQTFDCNNAREWYLVFDHRYAAEREQGRMPTSVWDDGGWFQIWSHAKDAFANNLHKCILGKCKMSKGGRVNKACVK